MQPTQNHRPLASDDPRHGTNAGAVAHWKLGETPCQPCADAGYRHRKARRHSRRLKPINGSRRRLQALHALGYSHTELATYLNVSPGTLSNWEYRADFIAVKNYNLIHEMFSKLCETPNPTPDPRTLKAAARQGFALPEDWHDIDADKAPFRDEPDPNLFDEVKVQRVLDGIRQDCTPAERLAILDQWTGSHAELRRITGWNIERMLNARKAAA